MKEVLITFEEEDLTGWVAPGSYLIDDAKRMGIAIAGDCSDPETAHSCAMVISKGAELLSEATSLEKEVLSKQELKSGKRLACQTKIEKPGELTVSSVQKPKKKKKKKKTVQEKFREEFDKMPLNEKVAALVDLEALTLRDTLEVVADSPYTVADKVMDVMAGFGLEKERKGNKAKRPKEHTEKKDSKKDCNHKADNCSKEDKHEKVAEDSKSDNDSSNEKAK